MRFDGADCVTIDGRIYVWATFKGLAWLFELIVSEDFDVGAKMVHPLDFTPAIKQWLHARNHSTVLP